MAYSTHGKRIGEVGFHFAKGVSKADVIEFEAGGCDQGIVSMIWAPTREAFPSWGTR